MSLRNEYRARYAPEQMRLGDIADDRIMRLLTLSKLRPTLPAGAVEVDTETAYGSTVRLSRSVRVF